MDVVDFFASHGIDTKTYNSGSRYVQCPKCHDDRKKRTAKELLVNFDTGYFKCFHCEYEGHILKDKENGVKEKPSFKPQPPPPQKFITKEPVFNWIVPDAVIEPHPQKPMEGKYFITWYYRNINGKLTGAKKMAYQFHKEGFNRIKEEIPLHLFTRDSGYYPCLFYERDIHTYSHAKIILLESEKTAAILRQRFKAHLQEFIYIATGGSNGLTNDKIKPLVGREILICYDCDNGDPQPDGTIRNPKGREGAQSAYTKLAAVSKAYVVDVDPDRTDGADLADMDIDIEAIRSLRGERTLSDAVIEEIKQMNRQGVKWTDDAADKIAAKLFVNLDAVFKAGKIYYENNKAEHNIQGAPLLAKIENFLTERYDFRRNSITKDVFYRDKSQKHSQFEFCNYEDVWRLLQHNLKEFDSRAKVPITDVASLLKSNFVTEVNPFEDYFHSLPHWDGVDHIRKLADYITMEQDQEFWRTQLTKALVRMIACSYGHIENRIIVVLVQSQQEKGKDTWLRFLCPPELKEYYKEDPLQINKDTEIALCQNFMWNLTELDQLNRKEISEIKGIISRAKVKQRKAYGRQEENMQRVVSFWGTTNKDEFLTDTQNTRWLCFRVKEINHSYDDYINNIHEVDIQKVWSQAWYLYKSGYHYNLNADERKKRDILNHTFENMPPEKQLIIKYLTPCAKDFSSAEFITVVDVMEYLIAQTGNKIRISPENIGRAMKQLDFEAGVKKINNKTVRGYYALKQPLRYAGNYSNYNNESAQQPEIFNEVPGDTSDLPF